MSRLLLAVVLACGGCGAALVGSSETLVQACDAIGDEIAEEYEAGELTQQSALDQLGAAREVCRRAHNLLEDGAE